MRRSALVQWTFIWLVTHAACAGDDADTGLGEHSAALAALGASCTSGSQCTSGICTDGVCCNVACAGDCKVCNHTDSLGTCILAPAGTHVCEPVTGAMCNGVDTSCPRTRPAGIQLHTEVCP